uniref:Uncharacterized protein n=1 Tax=Anguilla anguilla TaxID=7936 RepID=A0A0E9VB74_ANGAN
MSQRVNEPLYCISNTTAYIAENRSILYMFTLY